MMRAESQGEEDIPHGGGAHGQHRRIEDNSGNNREFQSKGRMVDEYYFDKANRRSSSDSSRYGTTITKGEYKAMSPRSESEEERMMRIAMEASIKDWEQGPSSSYTGSLRTASSEENDSSYGNGPKDSNIGRSNKSRPAKEKSRENLTSKLSSIGEDNLIDFGPDDAAKAVSQITISRHTTSDVSVLDDDNATTASFIMNTAWNSHAAPPPQQLSQPPLPAAQNYAGQLYPSQQQQQQPQFRDPTFRAQYAQQPWSSVGTLSSNPATPRGAVGSDASFAVPPPPSWDDYQNAFGGSTMNMGASIAGGSVAMTNGQVMSPAASVGMASPMSQQQYGMQQASQWSSFGPAQGMVAAGGASMGGGGVGGASPQVANRNKFDPLRADPFAS